MEPVLLAPFSPTTPAAVAGDGDPDGRRLRGTVKFFSAARGFGFVAREDGEDLFVHHSHVTEDGRGAIAPGSTVEFTVGTGRRGDEAQNVRVLAPAPG
jgi:CspA family cold shock protein